MKENVKCTITTYVKCYRYLKFLKIIVDFVPDCKVAQGNCRKLRKMHTKRMIIVLKVVYITSVLSFDIKNWSSTHTHTHTEKGHKWFIYDWSVLCDGWFII